MDKLVNNKECNSKLPIKKRDYKVCRTPKGRCFKKYKSCKKYKNKATLLESIAIIEKCMAAIINFESLKLKHLLPNATKVDDIIEINNSVRETLREITLLDSILIQKLELAKNIDKT